MTFVLDAIYAFLYVVLRFCLGVYYRITSTNPEVPDGPLIVLGNHPNALLDPLLVVSRLKRQVYFLANAGLFSPGFGHWFFNTFYCIPVERPKDVGGRPIDNASAFRRSREHLAAGGALYIAPEGTSEREYRLRPVKTGAARIGLDLLRAPGQDRISFLLGGVTYSDPAAFRSRVDIRFHTWTLGLTDLPGAPEDWATVEWLTAELEHRMQTLLFHQAEEADRLLQTAVGILAPWFDHREWRGRLAQLDAHLRSLGSGARDWVESLSATLGSRGLTVYDPAWGGTSPHLWSWIALPAVLVVLPVHLLLYGLPELVRKVLKADPVYDATVRFVAGLFTYLLVVPMLWWMSGSGLTGACQRGIVLLAMLALGPWCWDLCRRTLWDLQQIRAWRSGRDPGWAWTMDDLMGPLHNPLRP